MSKVSAGVVPVRYKNDQLEILLAHPGGPFWQNKDDGSWMIIKGEIQENESPEEAARREFEEETGVSITGPLIPLPSFKQIGGKLVVPFTTRMDFDPKIIASNTFELEWPPKSGQIQVFPEIDKVQWFTLDEAKRKILPTQDSVLESILNTFS